MEPGYLQEAFWGVGSTSRRDDVIWVINSIQICRSGHRNQQGFYSWFEILGGNRPQKVYTTI